MQSFGSAVSAARFCVAFDELPTTFTPLAGIGTGRPPRDVGALSCSRAGCSTFCKQHEILERQSQLKLLARNLMKPLFRRARLMRAEHGLVEI
jgi:hypothetical protein